MSPRVAVTGAAGFIGAHCCRALLESEYDVVGVDNFDPFYDRRLKEQGLATLADFASLPKAISGIPIPFGTCWMA
jgi:nucleoside-diphosphate-sugar epimerase